MAKKVESACRSFQRAVQLVELFLFSIGKEFRSENSLSPIIGGGSPLSSRAPIDLSRYVSNLDKNVYVIYNLPEEVIAVIFAYVSRSSTSFRENLAKLLADDDIAVDNVAGGITNTYSEKAAQFHEKWVVGYGHSSVAEHAIAHIGIEKISRLASAELELANTFNSFTEYSQRYQRPQRGQIYTPVELEGNPEASKLFHQLNEHAFDTYEQLLTKLIEYLHLHLPPYKGESERRHQLRIEKIAFEDARYVLTLATLTSLGMTGNGRALRDTLVHLLSSRHQESRQLALQMESEISKVIPTLLKHVKPSDYLLQTRKEIANRKPNRISEIDNTALCHATKPRARFIHLADYQKVLDQAIIQLYISEHNLTYQQASDYVNTLSLTEKEELIDQSLRHLRFFDHPIDIFRHLIYHIEMHISEANWHQLLRHNRGTAFSYGEPTVKLGYTIPPHIQEAGLKEIYTSFIDQATEIYAQMSQLCPEAAPYCVTNAHHRQVFASASLWELYHLINLRTSPEAQWDIAQIFTSLYKELQKHHPALARYARRRQ